MTDLTQEIQKFGARFPVPDGWEDNLVRYLPSFGSVEVDLPLLKVVDNDGPIVEFTASAICKQENLQAGLLQPDGLWIKWGNQVPGIVDRLVPGELKRVMAERGIDEIPPDWRIEFYYLKREEVLLSETR